MINIIERKQKRLNEIAQKEMSLKEEIRFGAEDPNSFENLNIEVKEMYKKMGIDTYGKLLSNFTGNEKQIEAIFKKKYEMIERFYKWFSSKAEELEKIPMQEMEHITIARVVVRMLSEDKFRKRIDSAVERGFVEDEQDFWERTVIKAIQADAVNTDGIDNFIHSINRQILITNRGFDYGDKIPYIKSANILSKVSRPPVSKSVYNKLDL